jgi:hypothetical protein
LSGQKCPILYKEDSENKPKEKEADQNGFFKKLFRTARTTAASLKGDVGYTLHPAFRVRRGSLKKYGATAMHFRPRASGYPPDFKPFRRVGT